MNKSFWALSAGILTSVALIAGCVGPEKYDSQKFAGSDAVQKNASNYWQKSGWWTLPASTRKIVITEFSVGYVTENVHKSGADGLSIIGMAEMFGAGRRVRDYGTGFKENFPTELYAEFVKALEAEGFEVVPMNKVTSHPAFAKLSGAQPGRTQWANERNYIGGADRRNSVKSEFWPVKGLPIVDDDWLKGVENAKGEAQLLYDLGAQAGLRVKMQLALTDDGFAVVEAGSLVRAIYDPQNSKTMNNTVDNYWVKGAGNIVSKAALRDDVPVATKADFEAFKGDIYKVDTEKFKTSILKMFPTYARMAATTLKK